MADYRQAGVDLDAHAVLVRRIADLAGRASRPEVLSGVGLFSGAMGLPQGLGDPVLVASTDSVGTKVLLAAACGSWDEVGRDVVIHCANDVVTSGASPLLFLDYLAVHALDATQTLGLVGGVAEACRQAGCALLGGETAQLPDLYQPGTFDLAGTMVGVTERSRLVLPRAGVGDAVLGLPSSGLHTNGFSLVRRILAETRTDPRAHQAELLAPSRLYSGDVRRLVEAGLPLHGMAHITGGGLSGNLDRVLPPDADAVLDPASWERPAVFTWLQRLGGIAEEEMRRVFNLGIGFCLVVPAEIAGQALALLPEARRIGELVPGQGRVVWR